MGNGYKDQVFALSQFSQMDIHVGISKIVNIMILPGIIKCRDKVTCSLNGGKFSYLRGGHLLYTSQPNVSIWACSNRSEVGDLSELPSTPLMLAFKDNMEHCSMSSKICVNKNSIMSCTMEE